MPTSVDRDDVARLVRDDRAQVVEVLPRREFEWAHLPGAVSVPLKELDARSVARLDRDRPVIVYCDDFQ